MEILNQSLRERDKSKDDSMAILADKLATITVRIKLIEQRQYQQQQQFY